MSQKYFLIDHIGDINNVIKQPLQQTQRIKFTAFDVSSNFIAFGATSGGVYIFNREPCDFLKLVPSKEGAVSHIAISPDEKIIAITSSRGLIVLIDNCFTDINVRYQIYREHEGHSITAIKWHFNDFYSGDNFGKVSVITLTSILSKAIFHSPSAILMHLGSPIVQLDTYSKYLLVSTKAKTFLCDTEEEHYRQIGKKLRDGEFGACFYSPYPLQKTKVREKEKTVFKILRDDEKFIPNDVGGAKIYCTRPGLRIWEASFDTSVACTYQFKTIVNQTTTEIIQWISDPNCRLSTTRIVIKDPLNFGKIFVADKFMLTFTNSHIFIFDIRGVNLLFVCNPLINIRDIKIKDNFIYVWNRKEMRILAFMDLELLLLKTLSKKQYRLCLDICINYNEEVIKLLSISDKLSPLTILKDKLKDDELLKEILPMLNEIKENKNGTMGIKKVENGYDIEAGCSYEFPKTRNLSQQFKEKLNIFDKNDSNGAQENDLTNDECIDPILDPNYALNILYRQYQVSKMYSNIETPQFYEVLSSKSLDEIVTLFKDFISYVKDMNVGDNNLDNWCYIQYLNYVSNKGSINILELDSMALTYIFEAYKSINSCSELSCECTFPLPPVHNFNVKFYDIGCELCKKLSQTDLLQFCTSIPIMWKFYITEFNHDIQNFLPLLIQYSDVNLIQIKSKNFKHDTWEDSLRLLIKLKRGICLNCEKKLEFDASSTISWKDFGVILLESLGSSNSLKLLERYARFIPNHELGFEFYQSCIFTTVLNQHKQSYKLIEEIFKEPNLSQQVDGSIRNYLQKKHTGNFETKEFTKRKLKCSSCDLPLKTPMLESSGEALACGHFFHDICLGYNKSNCSICNVQSK